MYIIQRRYQYRGRIDILWTSWFNYQQFSSQEDANKALSEFRKQKEVNKLKAEYKIIEK